MCRRLATEGQLRKLSRLLSFKVGLLLFSVFLVVYNLAFENKDTGQWKESGIYLSCFIRGALLEAAVSCALVQLL